MSIYSNFSIYAYLTISKCSIASFAIFVHIYIFVGDEIDVNL